MNEVTLISLRTDFELTGEYSRFKFLHDILVEKNYKVSIVTPHSKIKIHNSRRAESIIGHLIETLIVIREIFRLRKDNTIFLILLPTPVFVIIADIINLFTSNKILVYIESHLSNISWSDLRKYSKAEFLFYIIRFLINNKTVAKCLRFSADGYIISTEYQAKELIEIGISRERIHVIGNSVVIPATVFNKNQLREKYLLNQNDSIVCYIGHYFHIKGVDVLLKAFSNVVIKNKNIKLLLSWSGLGNNSIIKKFIARYKLEDNVIQFGTVKVFEILSLSDVFVLPYRSTFGSQCPPNLIIEGIASGIPLITSDLPLFREIFVKDSCLFFKSEDENDLADKISLLLTHDEIRNECKAQQNKMMESRFNKTMISNRLSDILLNLH